MKNQSLFAIKTSISSLPRFRPPPFLHLIQSSAGRMPVIFLLGINQTEIGGATFYWIDRK